jgi:hypothetical protein
MTIGGTDRWKHEHHIAETLGHQLAQFVMSVHVVFSDVVVDDGPINVLPIWNGLHQTDDV